MDKWFTPFLVNLFAKHLGYFVLFLLFLLFSFFVFFMSTQMLLLGNSI
ncbi:hypothetical protein BACINT_04651 [Bacteroides intestinalis DSM 17393]|uniref:Uncharacterized protein n=1 Tax=Bacteroides intestinalis DSM 17393 TaxID=471870 RepID=B3CH90_9BACE|nr:hypothetical protein BACINT_04651 [Bacteroides intestinalis DSM 17393]